MDYTGKFLFTAMLTLLFIASCVWFATASLLLSKKFIAPEYIKQKWRLQLSVVLLVIALFCYLDFLAQCETSYECPKKVYRFAIPFVLFMLAVPTRRAQMKGFLRDYPKTVSWNLMAVKCSYLTAIVLWVFGSDM